MAGFLVREETGAWRPLLRRTDTTTGIRYRLLPMTRAVLAEIFTPDEAGRHRDIIAQMGVHLLQADLAADVRGRVGALEDARCRRDTSLARSSIGRRRETAARARISTIGSRRRPGGASELRAGSVVVSGGWRLYSSGPGLFLHAVRACLLGVREAFGDVVFDPVLPHSLDGVRRGNFGPSAIVLNGVQVSMTVREGNTYRPEGWCVLVTVSARTPLFGKTPDPGDSPSRPGTTALVQGYINQ